MYKTAMLATVAFGSVLLLPSDRVAHPVGAPWLSVELPANPMDASTRDAVMVVRAYYHERPARFIPTGMAEGIVKGQRRSIPLEITEGAVAGTYAIHKNWPNEGHWLLNVGMQGQDGPNLVIELGANGGVSNQKYYDYAAKAIALGTVRVVGKKLEAAQLDAALRALAGDRRVEE